MIQFRHCIVGKEGGNFRPPQGDGCRDEWLDQVRKQAEEKTRMIATVFSPKCAFTTRIVLLKNEDRVERWDSMVARTSELADGVVINRLLVAGAICNADCPVVIAYEKNARSGDSSRIGVFHCGLRCVLPLDGGPGILHEALSAKRRGIFHPEKTDVFVGYGIGSCCYGLDDVPLEVHLSCVQQATKGPRIGKKSVNLYALIKRQLLAIGVPLDNIQIDDMCTACSLGPARKGFHSNVYDGANAGRNLVLAWME